MRGCFQEKQTKTLHTTAARVERETDEDETTNKKEQKKHKIKRQTKRNKTNKNFVHDGQSRGKDK